MATEQGVFLATEVQSLDDVLDIVTKVLIRLFVVVIAGVWVTFWGLVARLQLQQGEFLSAAVVTGLFVLPSIIGIGLYLGSSFPVD